MSYCTSRSLNIEPPTPPKLSRQPHLPASRSQERLTEGPIWVAIRDGVMVGTVSVVEHGESLYIRGMAVLPNARGLSVGQALLHHVEEFALAHGSRRLFLSTTPFLSRAIRLYEHFGFTRTGAGPHELLGTPLFTMEKML